jgi:hypothetical protein
MGNAGMLCLSYTSSYIRKCIQVRNPVTIKDVVELPENL